LHADPEAVGLGSLDAATAVKAELFQPGLQVFPGAQGEFAAAARLLR